MTRSSTDPLADLRERFLDRCRERAKALRDRIDAPRLAPEASGEIARIAHQLAGSAGTFGFQALGHAAAGLEEEALLAEASALRGEPTDPACYYSHLRAIECCLAALHPQGGGAATWPAKPSSASAEDQGREMATAREPREYERTLSHMPR